MAKAEDNWVKRLCQSMSDALPGKIKVYAHKRLPYACVVQGYEMKDGNVVVTKGLKLDTPDQYQTDLSVWEPGAKGLWVPRVVIECKLRISTHDALTYAAKANAHRVLHPYLRYGILVGKRRSSLPPWRLLSHGQAFDFKTGWLQKGTKREQRSLVKLIRKEMRASRAIQEGLSRKRNR